MTSGLRVTGLTVARPPSAVPVLQGVDLTVSPGEVVGIRGRSGCGKTTLLHTIAGILPWARSAGVQGLIAVDGESVADLDPGQRAHLFATCLDTPEAQLFLATPDQELAASRRLHPEAGLLDLITDTLGIRPFMETRVLALSSGQRQRTALAAALAASPRPVLLDEPTAHLDQEAASALAGLLRELADRGGCVLLTEQAGWRLGDAVARWLELQDGRLVPCDPPRPPELFPPPPPAEVTWTAASIRLGRGDRKLLEGGALSLARGEVVWLSGPNGAGKSSLLRALAGHRATVGASFIWAHPGAPARIGLALPTADLQLFSPTVGGELALAGLAAVPAGEVLRRHRLELLAGRAPWTLSRGEKQRLVHASLDALSPDLVLLDEPAQGLDRQDLVELAELIHAQTARGHTYLIASHRTELAGLAHRHLELTEGALREVG